MKLQLLATVGLMVAVLATHANARVHSRVQRQEPSPEYNSSVSTTESSPAATSPPEATSSPTGPETTSTTAPATCASGKDGGLVGLLGTLGNFLGNVVKNLPLLGRLGLTNPNGLLDLAGAVVQVQRFLNNMLTALRLNNLSIINQNGLLENLLNRIKTTLNNLLGGSEGTKWMCEDSGGSTGGILGRLLKAVGTIVTGSNATGDIGLVTLINFLLSLVDRILQGLGVTRLLTVLLPPL